MRPHSLSTYATYEFDKAIIVIFQLAPIPTSSATGKLTARMGAMRLAVPAKPRTFSPAPPTERYLCVTTQNIVAISRNFKFHGISTRTALAPSDCFWSDSPQLASCHPLCPVQSTQHCLCTGAGAINFSIQRKIGDLTCIPLDWKCDGESNCAGGEDEMNCTCLAADGKSNRIDTSLFSKPTELKEKRL